jgi:copper chaperone CopZ
MNTVQFKTSLKCEGCVAKITPGLNAISSIKKWNVDLKSPDKTLTVEGDTINESDIVQSLKKDGYTAAKL